MEDLKEIITELKKRRRFLKISQEDLAQIAEISLRSLKKLESGKGNPRFKSLSKIVDALGMTVQIRIKS